VERNHGGAIIEEEAWRRHLGSIWDLSGKHLGWIWESFGSHLKVSWTEFGMYLGVIWEAFGGLEAEEASGRHWELRSQKLQYLLAKVQTLHLIVNLTYAC